MTNSIPNGWVFENINHVPIDDHSPKARVGIIDTGCDVHHPCLANCKIDEIDFAAFEHAGIYSNSKHGTETNVDSAAIRDGLAKVGIDIDTNNGDVEENIVKLINSFFLSEINPLENPAHRYANHGTACAGLIAAHAPFNGELPRSSPLHVKDIGFKGVLPGCSLVCASTPFGLDVKPIIRALLYCVARDVDVILIPRGINDPKKSSMSDHHNALNWLIEIISEKLPVVMASGNGGYEKPEYPASKKWKHVIIAGAHNAKNDLSTYTSGDAETLTLTAPSNDEETNHLDAVRRFTDEEIEALMHASIVKEASVKKTSDKSIVSLESISQYKPYYTDQVIYGDDLQLNSGVDAFHDEGLSGNHKGFQEFGGTSAASSIVAGAIAYLQHKRHEEGKNRLTGAQMKDLLIGDVGGVSVNGRSSQSTIHRLDLGRSLSKL